MNTIKHHSASPSDDTAPVERHQAVLPPVGQRIRALRRLRGLSLAEVAKSAGVSYQGAQGLETKPEADVRLSTLCRLCSALGVEAVDLLDAERFRAVLGRVADSDHAG